MNVIQNKYSSKSKNNDTDYFDQRTEYGYLRNPSRYSLVHYRGHKSVKGGEEIDTSDVEKLAEIIGAFEDQYDNEQTKSLVSQIMRISSSMGLYANRENDNKGIAALKKKTPAGKMIEEPEEKEIKIGDSLEEEPKIGDALEEEKETKIGDSIEEHESAGKIKKLSRKKSSSKYINRSKKEKYNGGDIDEVGDNGKCDICGGLEELCPCRG